jgi:hypothetical protein
MSAVQGQALVARPLGGNKAKPKAVQDALGISTSKWTDIIVFLTSIPQTFLQY